MAYGPEFGRAPSVGPPSCGVLLGEFLAQMGRIEDDFTRRWDAARLGAPTTARQPAGRAGRRHHV